MKKAICILNFLLAVCISYGQNGDAAKKQAEQNKTDNDTLRYVHLANLANAYLETNPDSALYFLEEARALVHQLDLPLEEATILGRIGYAEQNLGNFSLSLTKYLSAIALAEDPKSEKHSLPGIYLEQLGFPPNTNGLAEKLNTLGFLHEFIGVLYENTNQYEKEISHLYAARSTTVELRDTLHISEVDYILGRAFLAVKKTDSAIYYEQQAYYYAKISHMPDPSGIILTLGKIYLATGADKIATEYLRNAFEISAQMKYVRGQISSAILLSEICRKLKKTDSSLYFANVALNKAKLLNVPDLLLRSYAQLALVYDSLGRFDSTAKYQGLMLKTKDSFYNFRQAQQFQHIDFDEQQRRKEIEAATKDYRDKLIRYTLLGGLVVFVLIVLLLWRNNRQKQKANILLREQKQETELQKNNAELALKDLKSTQAQLIQSEKMASLGELTAGIAHEIQNPLNFVNNFSEVNNELIDELETDLKNGNLQAADDLLVDVKENNLKITHHGKRAGSIVKGMLQHARASSGQRELSNLNSLIDEYYKFAYLAWRSKENSVEVKFIAQPDDSLEPIQIIPQDIGRVFLNIFNNAFYAVTEKAKTSGGDYKPTITVATRHLPPPGGTRGAGSGTFTEIIISDNGTGIPQKIADKIFQPFFTTKPTGSGTGLGLSLAYDIIKAHGGSIQVNSREGEYSEFIIKLPVQG